MATAFGLIFVPAFSLGTLMGFSARGVFMGHRGLAIWPKKLPASEVEPPVVVEEKSRWIQEEENLKIRQIQDAEFVRENHQRKIAEFNIKRLVF